MEQQDLFPEQLFSFGGEQRSGRMALLMGRQHERDVPRLCKGGRGADACQKAGHVAALGRARLLGYTHGFDLCQVELLCKLLQHLRQGRRVVEQRIALPQTKLARLDRQKALLCTNNLSGCVKHRQRGCIVARVDPKRITAHCSADSAAASSFRPWSRATAPSRPFTN